MFTTAAVNKGNVLAFKPRPVTCVGNLVRNGGFEDGLAHWSIGNGAWVGGIEPHEGQGAAGLGTSRRNRRSASLEQVIRLPQRCGPRFFTLVFQLAGRWKFPASLQVSLTWLDGSGASMGTGVFLHIPRRAIGNGSQGEWNTYHCVTTEAPAGAEVAQLLFFKLAGRQRTNFMVIDDVVLAPALPACVPG